MWRTARPVSGALRQDDSFAKILLLKTDCWLPDVLPFLRGLEYSQWQHGKVVPCIVCTGNANFVEQLRDAAQHISTVSDAGTHKIM